MITLYAQPNNIRPFLSYEELCKGIFTQVPIPANNIQFTDIGQEMWEAALKSDPDAKISCIKTKKIRGLWWEIRIMIPNLIIRLKCDDYNFMWRGAFIKAHYVFIHLDGDQNLASSLIKRVVTNLGRNPWEFDNWKKLQKKINISKEKIINEWKKILDYPEKVTIPLRERESVTKEPKTYIKVADETWIGTALLHYENPEQKSFTVREIIDRVAKENIFGRLRPGIQVHANLHCVANKAPNPGKYRMLFEPAKGKRRLFKEGDNFHPHRKGSKIKPLPKDIPEEYLYLLKWYDNQYQEIQFKENIGYNSPLASKEIEDLFRPKTKDHLWYQQNCIGEDEIPEKAVNGHNGGEPFLTKDGKIMRSGDSTWAKLIITPIIGNNRVIKELIPEILPEIPSTKPKSITSTERKSIDVKRGFSIYGEMFKFGVKITNNMNYKIYDIDVKLRSPEALSFVDPKSNIVSIRSLSPKASETAIFMLKPIRCVTGSIKGTVEYEDPITDKLISLSIRPKQIESICPFIEPYEMTEKEFIEESAIMESSETGFSVTDTTLEEVSRIIMEKCRGMYIVNSYDCDMERLYFFSSKSKVEDLIYLLTIALREKDRITDIAVKGYTTRKEGLVGFVGEQADSIRYTLHTLKGVREIVKMEVKKTINIFDSVVNRCEIDIK